MRRNTRLQIKNVTRILTVRCSKTRSILLVLSLFWKSMALVTSVYSKDKCNHSNTPAECFTTSCCCCTRWRRCVFPTRRRLGCTSKHDKTQARNKTKQLLLILSKQKTAFLRSFLAAAILDPTAVDLPDTIIRRWACPVVGLVDVADLEWWQYSVE